MTERTQGETQGVDQVPTEVEEPSVGEAAKPIELFNCELEFSACGVALAACSANQRDQDRADQPGDGSSDDCLA